MNHSLVLFLCLLTLTPVSVNAAEVPSYLKELKEQAAYLKLWEEPYWHSLGHYNRTLWGYFRSEAGSDGFLLVKKARRDPKALLDATLESFFSDELYKGDMPNEPLQQGQCKFPARYEWLKSKLVFDSQRLPERDCPELSLWLERLKPQSLTLIFAAAYLNSPSSMYGHTFLRVEREDHGSGQRLLDETINFSAVVDRVNSFAYIFNGLTGRFKGRFSSLPYYMKVQEYSNLESRDMWEYKLNLSSEGLRRMSLHSWELGSTYFPYYFINRNCSFQLLPILDIAQPGLGLTPTWPLYIVPASTIRWIADVPGLVQETVLRPSKSTKMLARRALLSADETDIATDMGSGELERGLDRAVELSLPRQAQVYDAAMDYLMYRTETYDDPGEDIRHRESKILRRRVKLDILSTPFTRPASGSPPHAGHRSSRYGMSYGGTGGSTFTEFHWRPGLHNAVDPPTSYVPNSSLEMVYLRMRHDNPSRQIYFQDATALHIQSITPWDAWTRPVSWTVYAGWRVAHGMGKSPWQSQIWDTHGGRGFAAETMLWRKEVYYALAEAHTGFGPVLRKGYRLGGGGRAGILFEFHPRWRAQLEGVYRRFPLGDDRPEFGANLVQNIDLTTDFTMRLDIGLRRAYHEIFLTTSIFL